MLIIYKHINKNCDSRFKNTDIYNPSHFSANLVILCTSTTKLLYLVISIFTYFLFVHDSTKSHLCSPLPKAMPGTKLFLKFNLKQN